MDVFKCHQAIKKCISYTYLGKIEKVIGMTIESSGPKSNVGDVCKIYKQGTDGYVLAEVVGFKDSRVLLMPYDDMQGVGPGCIVESTKSQLKIPVGSALVGRIIDGIGNIMDDGEPIKAEDYYPIDATPQNPLKRPPIDTVIPIGVKAIDGLLTCGKGQRMGIFAGSGVGKSTLM